MMMMIIINNNHNNNNNSYSNWSKNTWYSTAYQKVLLLTWYWSSNFKVASDKIGAHSLGSCTTTRRVVGVHSKHQIGTKVMGYRTGFIVIKLLRLQGPDISNVVDSPHPLELLNKSPDHSGHTVRRSIYFPHWNVSKKRYEQREKVHTVLFVRAPLEIQ